VSDIFQEVEEDVRRERYEQLWKKYGNYMLAAAGVLVLAVAGYQAWQNYDLSQRQKVSDEFRNATQAAQTGNAAKAETDFSTLAKDAPSGYATLAKFHLAGAYLAQGKRDPAVALLRDLMTSSDELVANTARLRLAWIMADASPKAEIVSMMQPMMAADSPWRFAASEVIAYIDLKDGARAQAVDEYQKLAQAAEAPTSLRQRAGGIAEYLKANPEVAINTAAGSPATVAAPPASLPSREPAPPAAPALPALQSGAPATPPGTKPQ
jgi:hypothetical protein